MIKMTKYILILVTALIPAALSADVQSDTVRWSGSLIGGGSTGDFAPYLIGANSC